MNLLNSYWNCISLKHSPGSPVVLDSYISDTYFHCTVLSLAVLQIRENSLGIENVASLQPAVNI